MSLSMTFGNMLVKKQPPEVFLKKTCSQKIHIQVLMTFMINGNENEAQNKKNRSQSYDIN